ncbi:MAG TPA: EAL domain-containing protein [Polyangiales bacterium]|nr:EAL domain-containing protein [Polyangiales bacterium]
MVSLQAKLAVSCATASRCGLSASPTCLRSCFAPSEVTSEWKPRCSTHLFKRLTAATLICRRRRRRYSSFGHIPRLHPDCIKLDMSITRGIERDRGKRALTATLMGFAHETGSELIAEGVQRAAEIATLGSSGVHKGQGYLSGRPAPIDIARHLVDRQPS